MTDVSLTAFFGDAPYAFALTDDTLTELERLTDTGVGALYMQAIGGQFRINMLTDVIRLGLIGGGMKPERAKTLTDTYARNRPLAEVWSLALSILEARWNGVEPAEAPAGQVLQ